MHPNAPECATNNPFRLRFIAAQYGDDVLCYDTKTDVYSRIGKLLYGASNRDARTRSRVLSAIVLNESSQVCCAALRCAVRCAVLSVCAHPQCNVLCRRNHRPLGDEWYAHYWSWRRASAWLEWQHGEKHAFWEQFYAKLIILPRQARDKLRENAFCAGDSRAGCQDYLVWRWLRVAGGVLEQIRQIQSPCG